MNDMHGCKYKLVDDQSRQVSSENNEEIKMSTIGNDGFDSVDVHDVCFSLLDELVCEVCEQNVREHPNDKEVPPIHFVVFFELLLFLG